MFLEERKVRFLMRQCGTIQTRGVEVDLVVLEQRGVDDQFQFRVEGER